MMDKVTRRLLDHHVQTFERHGATPKGVDWGDELELQFRYDKVLMVLKKDFLESLAKPTILDVGCGWGGLWKRCRERALNVSYTGVDVNADMIASAAQAFNDADFRVGDVFSIMEERAFDFVIGNGMLTQKLDVSVPEMENFARRMIRKMFALCRHGIAFNMMSTRVNFMASNLFYQNPAELLTWLQLEVAPRVVIDHGYSSLGNGRGKYYDFTVYVYRD